MNSICKTPLVFIPGVFGSMSDVIVPGTGSWSFGMAGVFYEPFVRQLEHMGYQRNRSLFIAFYDWRQPVPYAARSYLVQTIQEAKRKTGASKVNLLGHSMGGLVARAYVQGADYQDDVDQLISLCSPNAGSPANYCYWTGETLEHNQNAPLNIVSFYMNRYLSYLARVYPMDEVEAIHRYFPSLLDAVPSEEFGDYLIANGLDSMRFVPYKAMQVKNLFLDTLNMQQDLIKTRHIEVTLIAGIGRRTIQYLQEANYPLAYLKNVNPAWNAVISDVGDGNVMVNSVFALDGDKHLVEGGHMEVLFNSYSLLKRKLT